MTDHTPLTEQQLAEYEAIATRVADDPFFVSDCEGSLQVWREKALVRVGRDEHGVIDMYSFPSTYRPTDQVIELDLSTWDPGEDATDDQQRQDISDLVEARAAMPALTAEIHRQRARIDAVTALLDEQELAARAFDVPVPEWVTAVRNAIAAAPEVPPVLSTDRVWQIQVQRRNGSWIDHSPATIHSIEAHTEYEQAVASSGHLWSYRLVCSDRKHSLVAQHNCPQAV